MKRTARLDGSVDAGTYSPIQYVRDPRGLTADELLEMRKSGMTNAAIARAVNSKAAYVQKLIGKTPEDLIREAKSKGGRKAMKKMWGDDASGEKSPNGKANEATKDEDRRNLGKAFRITSLNKLSRLKAVVREPEFEGIVFDYRIVPQHSAVHVLKRGKDDVLLAIQFDQAETLAEEIMDILEFIKSTMPEAQ